MIPQRERDPVIRFGVFELDLTAGHLRKSGVRLKLQEQPFQVLAALLEKPGELVPREELKERLWSTDTFVDFDRGVNTAINKIREALGDSARSPLFIETVPKRGYRFIAELRTPRPALEADAVPTGGGIEGLPLKTQKTRRLRLALGLAFALLLCALGAWTLRNSSASLPKAGEAPANRLRAVPVTTTAGRELYPSLSPDGSQVAFSADSEGQPGLDIYVKLVGAGEALRLTTDPDDDVSPAWSPDGKTIAFVRLRPAQKIEVYLVPSLKGAEVKIHEVDDLAGGNPNTGPFVAWAPDSRRLAVPCSIEARGLGLCLLSLDNRELSPLTTPRAELIGDSSPAFSPDGRRLAFTREQSLWHGMLYVLDLDEDMRPSGEPELLTEEDRWVRSPGWTSNGNEIVFFAAGVDSDRGIWRRPARRGGESTLLYPLEDVATLTMSRRNSSNGWRLIYSAMARDSNIWRIRLSGSAPDTGPVKDRFIFSTWRDRHPQFSPDGRKVVFVSSQSGASELWLCDSDGSNAHPITKLEAVNMGFPRWSADGDKLVFMARLEAQAAIYVFDLRDGKPRRLTTGPMDEIAPGWSRDDQWVYFSRIGSGGPQLWKTPVEGGPEIQLTSQGGMIPSESWDGQTVYYSKPNHKLFQMPVAERLLEGPGTQVLDSVNPTSFLVVKQRLYFIEDNTRYGNVYATGYGETLKYLDLVTGEIAEVAPIQSLLDFGLTVSPDGQTVLYTQEDQAGSDLMMLEGFR